MSRPNPPAARGMTRALRALQLGDGATVGFAGTLLRQVGVDVTRITVEDPSALADLYEPDSIRRPPEVLASARAVVARWHARGKRVITLPSPELLSRAVAGLSGYFDVVLDGLDDDLRAHIGGLVDLARLPIPWVVITPHGLVPEPLPGSDLTAVATSGAMWAIGRADREPLTIPFDYASAQAGVIGAMVAIAAARDPGAPPLVDIATADVVGSYAALNAMLFVWEREGHRAVGSGGAYPYTLLPCADGSACLAARTNADWQKILTVLGSPSWGEDARFRDVRVNAREHADELDELITQAMSGLSRAELLARAERAGAPIAPVRTVRELATAADLQEIGALETVQAGERVVSMPVAPWLASLASPPPAFSSGEPTKVTAPSGSGSDWSEAGARGDGWRPLRGIRVLDFGWVVSGPFAALFAASLGADVIKIESRRRADNLRLRGAVGEGGIDWERADNVPLHHALNRGKRSFGVDLKREEGRELVAGLVAESDALIENFSVGALERMGFSDDVLQSLNPRLVRVSLTPAGRSGPASGLRGYAATTGALAGLESLIGYPGDEQPTGMLNFGIADYAAGALAAFTLVAAVCGGTEAFRSLDASQVLATTSCLGAAFAADAVGLHGFIGNASPFAVLEGVFVTADDGYVALSARNEEEARGIARAAGADLAAEPEVLRTQLAEWIAARRRDEAVRLLRIEGVRASPVLTMPERRREERFGAREFEVSIALPDGSEVDIPRMPWFIPGSNTGATDRGPRLGEHTVEICRDVLDLPDDRIEALLAAGVLEQVRG